MARPLISEVNKWQWLITWDNPSPADSSAMLDALSRRGKISHVQTKTTILLAPYAKSSWRQVRNAIEANLNQSRLKLGKAVYVNLRTGKCFECVMSRPPARRWKRVKT
ncbi:hypothetical protein [Bradyrhizobium sp. USDA 4473]